MIRIGQQLSRRKLKPCAGAALDPDQKRHFALIFGKPLFLLNHSEYGGMLRHFARKETNRAGIAMKGKYPQKKERAFGPLLLIP